MRLEVDATQPKKFMSITLVFVLLISAFFTIKPVSAEGTVKTNYISATFNVEMESATDFKVSVEATVSTITRSGSGTEYTGAYIESISDSNPYLLGAIAGDMQVMVNKTVSISFENAQISSLNDIPTYENGKFYDNYAVNLTNPCFGLNETVNSHDFINGVLDMGAKVSYNFNLHAMGGWNNTYDFQLADNIKYKSTNGELTGTNIQWTLLNNLGDESSKTAELTVFSANPTTPTSIKEDISLHFKLDARNAETIFSTDIITKKINIEKYNVLPSSITNLTYLPADGIRLFVDNGLLSWEDFNKTTIEPIENLIKTKIKTPSFNESLETSYAWDNETTIDCKTPYEINNMDNSPPVTTIIKDDDIKLEIFDISSNAVFGLVNTGAFANVSEEDLSFGETLPDLGYSYNATLLMPEGVLLEKQKNYTWNDTIPFSGDFTPEKTPGYFKDEIDSIIEIEVQSTDLNLLSFFSGDMKLTFGLEAVENKRYNITTLPEEFSLPEKIKLSYLNSDAIRLCIQEDVFTQEQISTFLDNEKIGFQEMLNKNLLPGLGASCKTNRQKFDDSLTWDNDITKMDKETPIDISSYAHGSYPVSFGFSAIPPKVDIPTRKINLTGVSGQSITYKMIFPKDIKITVSDTLNKSTVGKTKDGRYYFEVTFSQSEHNLSTQLSYKMTPSALFLLGLFMPCIISFIILVILVIVIYILRKKRRGGKKTTIIQEETDTGGYEEESYYVPPPPGSK